MTFIDFLNELIKSPIAIAIILTVALIIAGAIDAWIDMNKLERVVYRGRQELNMGWLLLKSANVLVLILLTGFVVTSLTACAASPKPHPIPLQSAPAKAEKTTIRTWLDFFEPRD